MTRYPELYQHITVSSFYHSIIILSGKCFISKLEQKIHKLYLTTGDHSNHKLLHQSSS